MITHIEGDLFKTECKWIAHGCNSHGVMGSGVAKIIKEQYPEAYEQYRQSYLDGYLTIGSVICAESNDKFILNCITQEAYGREGKKYVSYDAVDKAMINVNTLMRDLKAEQIAMPRIGAGLGGGNWNVIEAIITHRLKDKDVLIYTLKGEV